MSVDDTEKRMIATRVAYRVGPVRIRQQRVRQGFGLSYNLERVYILFLVNRLFYTTSGH